VSPETSGHQPRIHNARLVLSHWAAKRDRSGVPRSHEHHGRARPVEVALSNTVRNNTEHHRFELDVDGHTAVASYQLSPGVITFTHTEVPQGLSGRGIGSALARGALEIVRVQG
jgi:uncharacterized protein